MTAPNKAAVTESNSLGCDYQGYEFGAPYLDSVCIDGFLWDADSGEAYPDDDGWWSHTIGGDIPCPKCNAAAHFEYYKSDEDQE